MSPAVWYKVTVGSEQNLEFPLPGPDSPNTGYIQPPTDSGYRELGEWVRKTLTALGGEAAAAANGGDCGIAALGPGDLEHGARGNGARGRFDQPAFRTRHR